MSTFLILFLLRFIAVAKAFEPPPEFCGSISGLCENHPFCIKKPVLEDSAKKEFPRKFEYDSFMRRDFVENINYLRNEFACGESPFTNLKGETFPKAAHMQEVTWDDELEWGADQYASQCTKIANANCAVTPNYRNVAIFFVDSKQAHYKTEQIGLLTEFFTKLYDPYVLIPAENIKKYSEDFLHVRLNDNDSFIDIEPYLMTIGGVVPSSRYVESFKSMIHDEVSKIGCATYDCGKNAGIVDFITVCLLDTRNELNKPIYKGSNVAGSNCDNLNTARQCLCAAMVPQTKVEVLPKETPLHIERTTPLQCDKVLELTTRTLPTVKRKIIKTVTSRIIYPTKPVIAVKSHIHPKTDPPPICIERPPKESKGKGSLFVPGLITLIVFLNF